MHSWFPGKPNGRGSRKRGHHTYIGRPHHDARGVLRDHIDPLSQEALEFSPESPELLTTVGLLHLQKGDNQKAFESLGNALTHDPRDPKAILAAG